MIRRLEESSDNVLGWEVTGKVTEEEVRTLSEEFKAAVAEHGKVGKRKGRGFYAPVAWASSAARRFPWW